MSFEIVDGVLKKYIGNDETVRIPDGVIKVGISAFINCSNLKELIFPDSVTTIEYSALFNCSNLQKVVLSKSMTEIPDGCFSSCPGLMDVDIPEGITKIGYNAFKGCEKLTSITLPSTLQNIWFEAFEGCINLKKINISDLNSFMKIAAQSRTYNIGGLLWNRDLFLNGNPLEELIIPYGMQETGRLFHGNNTIKRVIIPETVKKISKEAFSSCENLREIVLSRLPEEIYYDAFWGCEDLTLTIPNREMYEQMKSSWKESFSTIHIIDNPVTSLRIDDGVTEIQDSQFTKLGDLENIEIPSSVTKIGTNAFSGCKKLILTKLPDSISSIGRSAFAYCSSISELELPKNLEEINESAFRKCTGIKKIFIPSSVRTIGPGAFASCDNLTEMYFESLVLSIDKEAFINCPALTLKFPEGALETKEKLPIALCSTNFVANDKELASIILYQKLKTWKDWILNKKIEKPETVFEQMMIKYRGDKKAPSDAVESFVLTHIDCVKKEDIEELLTLMKERKYKDLQTFEKRPEITDILSGKKAEQNPAEDLVKHYMSQPGKEILPEALKYAKKGIPFAKDGKLCSTDIIAFIVSESMRNWDKYKSVYGPFATEYLQDGSKITFSPEANQLGKELDDEALAALLEGFVDKPTYRPCLLAWANFATDDSIARVTSTYKTMINGNSKDSTKAGNIREALMINNSRGAMMFFDRIDGLDRYAALHGMSAMAMRDSIMLPAFDFDENGKKCYDIGGNTIAVSISPDLNFRIYDVGANKEIRSFPKKSSNPAKAEECSKNFAAFKKEVLSFAKLRSELLHKMHISGEYVDQDLWHTVYVDHPVIKHLAQLVVWEDEPGKTFMIESGKLIDATEQEIVPQGKIRVAHVLDMDQADVSTWQNKLAKTGKKQLFEQIWEPIIPWTKEDITSYYTKTTLTGEERNAMKKALKLRGVEVQSGYMEREFNDREGQYEFSNEGTMEFGNCLSVDYVVDPETKEVTFGKATAHVEPGDREMNAVLLELNKATVSSQVTLDNDASINMQTLSTFTASQISSLLNLAIEKKAEKCTALFLNYKNEHFPEFAEVNEFSLDW